MTSTGCLKPAKDEASVAPPLARAPFELGGQLSVDLRVQNRESHVAGR
jgi:hypothetical protein